MQVKLENTLENNHLGLDKMYRKDIIKLPEKIDHVQTLTSIAKLGLRPVHVSLGILIFLPCVFHCRRHQNFLNTMQHAIST